MMLMMMMMMIWLKNPFSPLFLVLFNKVLYGPGYPRNSYVVEGSLDLLGYSCLYLPHASIIGTADLVWSVQG